MDGLADLEASDSMEILMDAFDVILESEGDEIKQSKHLKSSATEHEQ